MDQLIAFIVAMVGSRPIEITAVIFGLINVGLLIRRSIWNYPFGLVTVTLFCWIFFGAKLYSDAVLQIYFFAMQVYGWWFWLQGKQDVGEVVVQRLSPRLYPVLGLVVLVGVVGIGTLMARLTDAAAPYPDAAIATLSIIAQFLLARRFLENWLFWIAVDVLAIGLFLYKDLQPTAALYLVFLGMASFGFVSWWRTMKQQCHG